MTEDPYKNIFKELVVTEKTEDEIDELKREHRAESFALTTTATTANQQIGSYTPKVRKHFVIQLIIIEVYLTTLDATAALLGKLSLYFPTYGQYILRDLQASNTSSGALFGLVIPIPEGYFEKHYRSEIRAICTPAVVTSMKWIVNLLGYDK